MALTRHDLPIGSAIPEVKDEYGNPSIIFREIDIKADAANRKLDIVYLPPLTTLPPGDIGAVVDNLARRLTTRSVPAAEETSPLDLNCRRESYVIFKLASDWNWRFAPDGHTFTTKADEGGRYFNLINVVFDSTAQTVTSYRGGEPMEGNCRLLYFRARGGLLSYRDGFNLIVELDLGTTGTPPQKRRTSLVVDPDIRHPGGSEG